MSWKQLPDGKEKLETFLRGVQESEAAKRPTDPSTRTPPLRKHRLGWILLLALVAVAGAVWLLW